MLASNHQPRVRFANDENSALSGQSNGGDLKGGTVTKTPSASSKQRRALGDISNRKRSGGLGGGGVVLKPSQTPSAKLNKRPILQPLSSTKQQQSSIADVVFLPRASSSKVVTTVKPLALHTDETKRKLPSSKKTSKSALRSSISNDVCANAQNDPVDDIELPAGRLWIDQPSDEEETVVSWEGVSTMKEDWAAANAARHKLRMKYEDEQELEAEMALTKHLDALWNDDDILGTDVLVMPALSFDLDEEIEALSLDGPTFCPEISF